MAYDVEKNADVFYKEVPDGVRSLSFGRIPSQPDPLVIVGGHCSIQVGSEQVILIKYRYTLVYPDILACVLHRALTMKGMNPFGRWLVIRSVPLHFVIIQIPMIGKW